MEEWNKNVDRILEVENGTVEEDVEEENGIVDRIFRLSNGQLEKKQTSAFLNMSLLSEYKAIKARKSTYCYY
ncbi:hypothetical protein CTI12_AA478860 [Artemisia annua]|uniref:Uncharacterized protein n=1 Tax=Artemisia annua TaxID=35608 RepID=A0A2U1LLK3_ARTAN|nr:hypothetical protein CTI12_AA478860 [Artemisia annua]